MSDDRKRLELISVVRKNGAMLDSLKDELDRALEVDIPQLGRTLRSSAGSTTLLRS